MSEYFAAGRRKNLGVVTNDDFTLTISFDNGEKRRYDVRPLLKDDTVFEPFKNTEAFRRVYVDENNAIAWDIDPTVDSRKIIRWICVPIAVMWIVFLSDGRRISDNCLTVIGKLAYM